MFGFKLAFLQGPYFLWPLDSLIYAFPGKIVLPVSTKVKEFGRFGSVPGISLRVKGVRGGEEEAGLLFRPP